MNYTKRDWKIYEDSMACVTDVIVEDGMGFFNKVIAHINRKDENWKSNAHLICEAVNACQAINEDNPLAVAQSIKEMYEALQSLKAMISNIGQSKPFWTPTAIQKMEQALDKAGGKP